MRQSLVRKLIAISATGILFLLIEFGAIHFFNKEIIRGMALAYQSHNAIYQLIQVEEVLREMVQTTDPKIFQAQYESVQTLLKELAPLLTEEVEAEKSIFAKMEKWKEAQGGEPLVVQQLGKELTDEIGRLTILIRERHHQNFASVYAIRNLPNIIGGTLVILLSILLAFASARFIRQLHRSLSNLQRATEKVGEGDFGFQVEVFYPDEIGQLTEAFNQMSTAIQKSERLLQERNKELEQFVSIASHDLQEPLRKIVAYGDILIEEESAKLGAEGKENIQIMQKAALRMQALIDSLLTYSRITRRVAPFESVDLHQLVQEICEDLEVAIREAKATIDCGPLPVIKGDPVQMRQLFQNLIANAVKFRKKEVPPLVKIESRPVDAKRVEIKVSDNGIGFDPKYAEKIFLPFQRLHSREEYPGSGIGLATCKKIVERHGGTIKAESSSGKGSAFILQLPL